MKIKVNGSEFLFFNDITISLALDSIASSFAFSARFNPNNALHKNLFRPLSFPRVEIFKDDGTLLLTGEVINQNQKSQAEPELTTLSGYSTTGVLEDVNIPLSLYPLESINRSLKEIAERFIAPFNLNLVIDSSVAKEANQVFKKTSADPGETIENYLAELAAQRNIVLGHDEKGRLKMYRPDTKAKPKYFINKENGYQMSWAVNGQSLHSNIGVIRQPSDENPNVSLQDEVNNPLVGKYRPKVSILSSGQQTDTKKTANNKMAAELSALTLQIDMETFLDLVPGDIVEVQNDEVFLYSRTRFIVSAMDIKETEEGYKTSLDLVLPETYTGETPQNIFA